MEGEPMKRSEGYNSQSELQSCDEKVSRPLSRPHTRCICTCFSVSSLNDLQTDLPSFNLVICRNPAQSILSKSINSEVEAFFYRFPFVNN